MRPNIRIFNHIRQNDKSGCRFYPIFRIIHSENRAFQPSGPKKHGFYLDILM